MNISTYTLQSWEDFERSFLLPINRLYRGQSNIHWKLESTLGRHKSSLTDLLRIEENLVEEFKRRLKFKNLDRFLNIQAEINPYDTEWQWLCQAQHLGVPTRLLDWTTSYEIALYFAVEAEQDEKGEPIQNDSENGAFWVQQAEHEFFCQDSYTTFPWKISECGFCNPPISWTRIDSALMAAGVENRLKQKGKFFAFSNKDLKTSIEELSRFLTHEVSGTPTLERVIIPKELKPEFRKKLKSLGVTRNTVYWENKNGNNPHDLNELQQLVKNLKLDFGF